MKTTHSHRYTTSFITPPKSHREPHLFGRSLRRGANAGDAVRAFTAPGNDEAAPFWSSDVLDRLQEPLTRYHE